MARQALNPNCPQCGGPVSVPEGAAYARCSYCSAESFVDLTGALLHQVVKATIGRSRVPGLVKAGAMEAGWPSVTITDLDLVAVKRQRRCFAVQQDGPVQFALVISRQDETGLFAGDQQRD